MNKSIRSIWPLFVGVALIASNTGIQGTLLGVRAQIESFSTTSIGMIMSGYFLGFLLGSKLGQLMIKNVGHVRTFGALTALASIAILLHPVFINIWAWFFLRILTGFATSGIYLVSESWLNQSADDNNRGQLLSVYAIIMFLGIFFGQFLLNLAAPDSFHIFVYLSVLLSFASIPILISSTPCPVVEQSSSVSISKLFGWAPYGLIVAFLINMGFAIVFGMGAVYAQNIGMSIREISWFMAAYILGGIVLQWPLGRLSDKYDRRLIVTISSGFSMYFAFMSLLYSDQGFYTQLFLFALLGGFMLPLYSLAVALVNDHMRSDKIIAASGTLILISGIGASIGPIIAAFTMNNLGNSGFFVCIVALSAVIFIVGVYRVIFCHLSLKENKHEFSLYAPLPNLPSGSNLIQKD